MNSTVLINIFRFIFLLLLQVMLLNNINFLGYLNPQLYILFILLYPYSGNQTLLLFTSFLLGISIDLFEDSGGIHAMACLVAAYIRPIILRFLFGINYDFQTIKFTSTALGTKIGYVSYMVLIHHFVLYFFEYFNITHIVSILQKTLLSSIFTIIVALLSIFLFIRKTK